MEGAYALVRGGSSTSNIEPTRTTPSQGVKGSYAVYALVLQGESNRAYGLVRGDSSTSNHLIKPTQTTPSQVCKVLMHKFGVIQACRTSSNLHNPHQHRDSKVCKVLMH